MTTDRMDTIESRLKSLETRVLWMESIPAMADYLKLVREQGASAHAAGLAANREEEVAEELRMRAAGRAPMIKLDNELRPGVDNPDWTPPSGHAVEPAAPAPVPAGL